jgi:dTDP-4-dehydrorhamnose 3,5-epimerase
LGADRLFQFIDNFTSLLTPVHDRHESFDMGMFFEETRLQDAFLIEPERFEDERGFFARAWSEKESIERRIDHRVVESNISFNTKKETLRGMHVQLAPHAQVKLVRATRGAFYDVPIDLRPDSATFLQWVGVELTADNHLLFDVPEGFAHGCQTLEDNTEVFYRTSEIYAPECVWGTRWNDRAFGIKWPPARRTVIERDQGYPDIDISAVSMPTGAVADTPGR